MEARPEVNLEPLFAGIEKALEEGAHPVAAFDADGTLWTNDMGEALFLHQIRNRLLPRLPEDAWGHYEKLKCEVSHEVAYLWLAQINEGLPLEQVRRWAADAVGPLDRIPLLPFQKKLIDFLRANEIEVYIVTASVAWAVEPAARAYGIPPENVLGIKTRVVSGRVTMDQEGPITYRAGKAKALLEVTEGCHPLLAAGNTEGDLFLLESATHVRLVVASAKAGEQNYETERKMVALARKRGWHCVDLLLGDEPC